MPKKPKDSDKIAAILGPRVRAARELRGLTQEGVARIIGCNPEYYARLERGHGLPSTPMLKTLVQVFETSADELLGDAVAPRPAGDIFDTLPADRRDLARRIAGMGPEACRVFRQVVTVAEGRQDQDSEGESSDGDEPAN